MTKVESLLSFIKKSPSQFHAVANISKILLENGFHELLEGESWNLKKDGKYFVTRNSSSIIAFILSSPSNPEKGFSIIASHSDSPSFKIKENPEIDSAGGLVMNVEKYGGMLIQPWFDRPLSLAGRIFVKDCGQNGKISIKQILVNLDRDLLMIPNLAIHMNRDANEGHKINVQNEIRPVLSMNKKTDILSLVAESARISKDEIISHDLYLYNRCEPSVWGAENEFISSPKLDDLECVFTSLEALLNISRENCDCHGIPLYCVFDNEEVGSSSRQGADSTFLNDTLSRISEKLGRSSEEYKISLAKSLMISADNAHALHPNYISSADPVNRPEINKGIVIKYNAAQKYTTDALSSAVFKEICRSAGVPFQIFTNNSNITGGSTLGNISQNHVSIPSVDIGLAQWAMHSPYESAGAKDVEYMIKALETFYRTEITIK